MVFSIWPPQKYAKSLFLNFSTKSEKLGDSDFAKIFENGAKLKMPSDINHPLIKIEDNHRQYITKLCTTNTVCISKLTLF
jgi:hypothetical protein